MVQASQSRHFASSSNVMNNSHLRHVPKSRMKFNYKCGDGKMSLIFDAGDANKNKFKNTFGKAVIGASLPACLMAMQTFGPAFWLYYPAMMLPAAYFLRRGSQLSHDI